MDSGIPAKDIESLVNVGRRLTAATTVQMIDVTSGQLLRRTPTGEEMMS
jgi:hypothetical protein